jgi:hypothetical protein
MSYYRRKFNERVAIHRPRLRRFLTKLENNPPALLDVYAEEADREVWQEVDCELLPQHDAYFQFPGPAAHFGPPGYDHQSL